MNGFTQLLLKAGPTRLFAMLGIAAVVAALLFTLVFRMGGESKALLFAGVETREPRQHGSDFASNRTRPAHAQPLCRADS